MEWIIPWNPDYYPHYRKVFHELNYVDQDQKRDVSEGDIAYIYISSGSESGRDTSCERAIKFKCRIGRTDKLYSTIDERPLGGTGPGEPGRWMELRLLFEFRDPGVKLEDLRCHGLSERNCLQGQQSVPPRLLRYLNSLEVKANKAGVPHYWLWAPGRNAHLWDKCLREGIMGIEFNRFHLGNVSRFRSREELIAHCRKNDSVLPEKERINAQILHIISTFCEEINVGDIVYAKQGMGKIIGVGKVLSGYYYDRSDGIMKHRRRVAWEDTTERTVDFSIRKTLTDITGNNTLRKRLESGGAHTSKWQKSIDRGLSQLKGEEREHLARYRINQSVFRSRMLEKYEGRCCLCGVRVVPLLKAGHIKPWSRSNEDERLDDCNGLLLCPNHDNLFELGYIAFRQDGRIRISPELSRADRNKLGLSSKMRIDVSEGMKKYLRYKEERFKA